MKKRFVLTTFGIAGRPAPLHRPGHGLQARGHEAVIATSGNYRQKIETLGIGFPSGATRPVRHRR